MVARAGVRRVGHPELSLNWTEKKERYRSNLRCRLRQKIYAFGPHPVNLFSRDGAGRYFTTYATLVVILRLGGRPIECVRWLYARG